MIRHFKPVHLSLTQLRPLLGNNINLYTCFCKVHVPDLTFKKWYKYIFSISLCKRDAMTLQSSNIWTLKSVYSICSFNSYFIVYGQFYTLSTFSDSKPNSFSAKAMANWKALYENVSKQLTTVKVQKEWSQFFLRISSKIFSYRSKNLMIF